MKKQPISKWQRANKRKPFIGTMADESSLRKQAWLRHGCNAFDTKKPTSQPLSFWTEQDILQYIVRFNLNIADAYGEIINTDDGLKCTKCQRTGCAACPYGAHLEKDQHRYLVLKEYYPKQYNYAINGGEWIDNPNYDPNASTEPNENGWVTWNPPKLWVPSKKGLGLGRVFDMINEQYGKDFILYK